MLLSHHADRPLSDPSSYASPTQNRIFRRAALGTRLIATEPSSRVGLHRHKTAVPRVRYGLTPVGLADPKPIRRPGLRFFSSCCRPASQSRRRASALSRFRYRCGGMDMEDGFEGSRVSVEMTVLKINTGGCDGIWTGTFFTRGPFVGAIM